MNQLELVQWKAQKLLDDVEAAGYRSRDIDNENVHEVVNVIEQIITASSTDDVPRQVGGTIFFKSVDVEKELGIQDFSTEFRKIHEALGRDAELEERLVNGEEELPAHVINMLDEQERRKFDLGDE